MDATATVVLLSGLVSLLSAGRGRNRRQAPAPSTRTDPPGRWDLSARKVYRCLCRGQLEPEGRAGSGGAVEADPAAVGFDDLPAEREPETGAADGAGVGRVDAEELREEPT